MEKKIFLGLLGLSLLALAAAILLPGGRSPDPSPRLPWDIRVDASGEARVFGLTLGRSTLAQAREVFEVQDELSLFVSPKGRLDVESYFQRVYLSGIRADLVVKLLVDEQTAAEMYDRGTRISQLGGGVKKVTLAQPDLARLEQAPIGLLTYLPAADLEPSLIAGRFGEPARRLEEPGGVVHWLYPDRGLDIAVNPDGKEVLQYVPPRLFESLVTAPLELRDGAR
jgi:hypothetical protein